MIYNLNNALEWVKCHIVFGLRFSLDVFKKKDHPEETRRAQFIIK